MPFSSQAQQRFAFGTGQPWAKRWADETDFSKLPKRVQRIRSRRLKGCTCDEATKESLGPGITRIRGNLCNVHGKYGPCDAALSGKKKPKKGRAAKPKKAPKAKLTPEQRAAARTAQRETNRANVAKRMADSDTGLSPSGSAALAALTKGEQPSKAVGDGLVKMGLAELANDGSYRLSSTGHAANTAMEAGDYQRAVDAISRGTDASTARGERTAAHQERVRAAEQRKQEVAQRRADATAKRAARQAKRGSGGGKKPAAAAPKPPVSTAPARAPARTRSPSSGASGAPSGGGAAPVKQQPQIAPALQDAARKLSAGTEMADTELQALVRNGLARLGKDGTPVLTAAGLSVTKKAQSDQDKAMFASMGGGGGGGSGGSGGGKGGGGSKLWAKGEGGKRTPTKGAAQQALQSYRKRSDEARAKKSDAIKLDAHASMAKRNGDKAEASRLSAQAKKLHDEARALETHKRGLRELRTIDRAGYHMSNDGSRLVPSRHSTTPKMKEFSFTVYKDASGSDRWLSVSSTAYRDRDQEIVSTKALSGAVALADASGYRGPLRFWHVPNADFGDCDYQATAQDGRFLIESGTFRSPALAAAVKAHASDYQISIGFTHPANEPDATGVFHHIAIFERSLVPRGRASNPFTQVALATKEQRMLTTEKQAELTRLLGGDSTLLQGLLETVATTDKAAQDGGVSFKDTDIRAIIREELASLLGVAGKSTAAVVGAPDHPGANLASEKAAPPIEGSPEEEAAESPEEAAAEGDTGDGMGDDNMLNPAEIAAIAQAVVQAIGPSLNIEAKMAGHLNEMKGLIGGMSTQKDAAIAETKAELEKVKAQVADLSGSAPRILAGGYRASQAQATVTTDDTKLKEAQPSADPVVASFGAFMTDLGFGQPSTPGA